MDALGEKQGCLCAMHGCIGQMQGCFGSHPGFNPESMDVLLKCRDVSVKSILATPSETSASRIGSATHAAYMETERSPLPSPRNIVIRMFTIGSIFARITAAIRGYRMPAHACREPDRRMTRTSWGGS